MSEQHQGQMGVIRVCSARLPTTYAEFMMTVYHDADGREHVCLSLGEIAGDPLLVRIHSECLTGDAFGSIRCDCRDQLHFALASIAEEGRGMLVYLRQEGRGIGLTNKVHAYLLQDEGLDTVDANLHLGLPVDDRDYSVAAAILRDQRVKRVRLLTNNPRKVEGLRAGRIEVVERVPHVVEPRPENQDYLRTKAVRLGHMLGLTQLQLSESEPAPVVSHGKNTRSKFGIAAIVRRDDHEG